MPRDRDNIPNGHGPPLTNGYHHKHSDSNGYASSSSSSAPTAGVAAQFAALRDTLRGAESPEEHRAAIVKLLESLPPAHAELVRHHVAQQHRQDVSVNIDSLAAYIAKLEHASSALATASRPCTPADQPDEGALKQSPKRPTLAGHHKSSDYIDFAPSRPNVSLLLSDEKPNPPRSSSGASDGDGGSKQEMR